MHSSQPLVSVVIPCYNHEQFVQDSIQSVIDQDYENIELIIIDDGSEDSSVMKIKEMVESCQKRFVRFEFRNRENKGLCATLNEALEWCEGNYFSPLASDDIALPNKTSFLVSKMINTDYSAVFGNIKSIGDKSVVRKFPNKLIHTFQDVIMQINNPSAPAALIRTEDIKIVGGYNERVALEDWYMWLKLTSNGKKLISYNKVVCLYRKHENNTVNNIELMHIEREKVLGLYKNNYMYKEAIINNHYLRAKQRAYNETFAPIHFLIKYRYFNKKGCSVVLKVISPKFLINKKRDIIKFFRK